MEFPFCNFDLLYSSVLFIKITPFKVPVKEESQNLDPLTSNSEPSTVVETVDAPAAFQSTNPFLEANNNLETKIKEFTLTDEERRVLFEETPSTSNALKAVMGYVPTDDARLCKFYDGKEGSCFKGVHCSFVHQKPLEGNKS